MYGANEVESPKASLWKVFALKFWGLSAWLLEVVIILSLVLQRWINAGVVFALLLFNAFLSFREDVKAREAVEALKSKLHPTARVLRSAEWRVVNARELVPGDVIR